MMKDLICKNCGDSREVGRRLCRPCNLKRLLDIAKSKPRYMFQKECMACKSPYQAWTKDQELCKICYSDKVKLSGENKSTNNYIHVNGQSSSGKKFRHLHRKLAEDILGRELHTNEVIHHLDNNPQNNELTNLMMMDRRLHGKLHKYLNLQRVILEKSKNENSENCWEALIVPMTTAWLATTSAKVQKLSEIGQSAAELLKEEGSETMH